MVDNKSTIPQFTRAAYQSWAFKLKFSLIEKGVHTVVCDFNGRARKPCPASIERLTRGELRLLPAAGRLVAELDRDAAIAARGIEILAWMDLDVKLQALFLKCLGAFEQTHVKKYGQILDLPSLRRVSWDSYWACGCACRRVTLSLRKERKCYVLFMV